MATANLPVRRGVPGEQIQLVSFTLADEEYAVEVLKVREVINMTPITHLPNTPPSVEGVINLRGQVIPIVSLRKRFNLGRREAGQQARILVMEVAGKEMGFIVDAVSEVIRIRRDEIKPPPPVATCNRGQEFICGVIHRSDSLLLMLELDRVFSAKEQTALLLTME